MASARMMTRASAVGTAKPKEDVAEQLQPEAPRRLHSGGLRAAMTTLMVRFGTHVSADTGDVLGAHHTLCPAWCTFAV